MHNRILTTDKENYRSIPTPQKTLKIVLTLGQPQWCPNFKIIKKVL